MSICRMVLDELPNWLASKPQCGDVAYLIDNILDKRHLYVYRGPDDDPYSRLISDQFAADWFMKEVDKLKVEEPKVEKKCDNCKYFDSANGGYTWCKHKDQAGTWVPKFTCCDKHEFKEKKSTPFDGMKLYLKDTSTGELSINYICEDCGKEMQDAPDRWWLVLPINNQHTRVPGYHFRCEDCDKKKEGKR